MQTIGEQLFPYQYIDFQMMKTFGWTPSQIKKLSEAEYQLVTSLMLSEGKAAKMKAIESQSSRS
jgi:hypothetical protein